MVRAYYIIRRDLKMPFPKLAIQVGNGTDCLYIERDSTNGYFSKWFFVGDRQKMILGIESLKRLEKLKKILKRKKIKYSEIWDFVGFEFSVKALTGLVVHPIEDRDFWKRIKKVSGLQSWE